MKIIDTRDALLNFLEKKTKVCEIGVFKGEFSKKIYKTIEPSELHLIDIFDGMMCSGDKDGNNIEWTNLNEEYEKLKVTYESIPNVHIHKGKSDIILNNFIDDYFDIIYIDGDHTYEGVKIDMEVSYRKVKPRGMICGHDYVSPKFEGVVRAVNEFCEEKNLEIDFITNDGCPTYCIVKR